MSKVLRLSGIAALAVGAVLAGMALSAGKTPAVGELSVRMASKERLLSGVYKVYGMTESPVPLWLAKTVIRNDSDARVTNLRVRYKIGEYSDWCPWHEYAAVDPTQTVVDLYHPILSSACAKLTAQAPADLEMETEYLDGDGHKQTKTDSRRIVVLGRHEFYFSDLTSEERTNAFQDEDTYSPLLAAWVTSNDDVVARLASLGDKMSGGLGASESDENTIKVMAALYDVMLAIDITYQHPGTQLDPGLSYDIKSLQSLQYPRDTIEKRSGTCIDLAILYASMLQSVNISPILVSLDGHCFPIAVAPSGALIPVEATGVGGGGKHMSFGESVKCAQDEWAKVQQSGRFDLVRCRECWGAGIANPELEPLPPDILERWGITTDKVANAIVAIEAQHQRQQQQAQQQQQQVAAQQEQEAPEEPAAAPQAAKPTAKPAKSALGVAVGTWSGSVTAPNGAQTACECEVRAKGGQIELVETSQYDAILQDGYSHTITEKNTFVGSANRNRFTATCSSAEYTVDGARVPPQGLPLHMNGTVGNDGESISGTVRNAFGLSVSFKISLSGAGK